MASSYFTVEYLIFDSAHGHSFTHPPHTVLLYDILYVLDILCLGSSGSDPWAELGSASSPPGCFFSVPPMSPPYFRLAAWASSITGVSYSLYYPTKTD
jgi:hypothetical protein